jgi:regulator of CtrA degradation
LGLIEFGTRRSFHRLRELAFVAIVLRMTGEVTELRVHRKMIDSLYVEAMVLADEARGYFDQGARVEREALDPLGRVTFSCESLKVTTRTQRAVDSGELSPRDALDPARRLGDAPITEDMVIEQMPADARGLINASIDLHRRVARLDGAQSESLPADSPVQWMQARLAMAF